MTVLHKRTLGAPPWVVTMARMTGCRSLAPPSCPFGTLKGHLQSPAPLPSSMSNPGLWRVAPQGNQAWSHQGPGTLGCAVWMFPNLIWSPRGQDSLGLLGPGFLQANLELGAGMEEMFDAQPPHPLCLQGPAPALQQAPLFPPIPLAPDGFMKTLLVAFDSSHQIWLQVGSGFPKPTPECSASLHSSQEELCLCFYLPWDASVSLLSFPFHVWILPGAMCWSLQPGWLPWFCLDCF